MSKSKFSNDQMYNSIPVQLSKVEMDSLKKSDQRTVPLDRVNESIEFINGLSIIQNEIDNNNLDIGRFNKNFYLKINTIRVYLDPNNDKNKEIISFISKFYSGVDNEIKKYSESCKNRNIFTEPSTTSIYHIMPNYSITQGIVVSTMSRENCCSNKMYSMGPNIGNY